MDSKYLEDGQTLSNTISVIKTMIHEQDGVGLLALHPVHES